MKRSENAFVWTDLESGSHNITLLGNIYADALNKNVIQGLPSKKKYVKNLKFKEMLMCSCVSTVSTL